MDKLSVLGRIYKVVLRLNINEGKKKGPGISTWAFPLESPSKNQILAK